MYLGKTTTDGAKVLTSERKIAQNQVPAPDTTIFIEDDTRLRDRPTRAPESNVCVELGKDDWTITNEAIAYILDSDGTFAVWASVTAKPKRQSAALAPTWVFGLLLILFLMAVVSHQLITKDNKPISPTIQSVIGILSALLAGACGFFLTGTVTATVAPNVGRFGSISIQAAGGMALFVIVLWWWMQAGANRSDSQRSPLETTREIQFTIDFTEGTKITLNARSIVKKCEEDNGQGG